MQKKSQKKLDLTYSEEVIDIVQFGSSIMNGKTFNDIDVAVIFNKIPLKDQLEYSQEIKRQIEKYFDKPIHMQSYDLYSFFDKGNFAKESILFYGKSLITDEYFSQNFGLIPKIQLNYSLIKLEKKDKIKFNYTLNGRGGNYGLLRQYNGKLLNPGLIEIPPECEEVFLKTLKEITSDIKINKTFKMSQ